MNIPGYRIQEKIADGGMATVYLAVQESVDRTVALKLLSKDCADRSFGDRFVREARIASKLVHPNIVTIFDAGSTDEYQYIAMEYIPGKDLAEARFSMSMEEKLAAVTEVAKALDYANANGFVHRDIKPSNILMHATDGRAVVLDFGTAKAEESQTRMTMLGETIGTPYFMSPEQAQALSVDGRSDLYSLGVVFYTLITGEVPFDAQSSVEVGIKHVTEPVPQLPIELSPFQDFINKAMAKIPGERFQTGDEFQRAMNAIAWSDADQPYPGNDDATQLMPAAIVSAPQPVVADKPGTERVPVGRQISGWLESVTSRLQNWLELVKQEPRQAMVPGIIAAVVLIGLLVLAVSGGDSDEVAAEDPSAQNHSDMSSVSPETADAADDMSPPAEAEVGTVPAVVDTAAESVEDEVEPPSTVASQSAVATAFAANPEQVESGAETGDMEYNDDITESLMESADAQDAGDAVVVEEPQSPSKETAGETVEVLLARANSYYKDNALTVPEGKNAYQTYRQVLDLDPFNREALLGITRIVDKYRQLAEGKIAEKDYRSAVVFIDRALGLDPNNSELPAMLVKINDQLDTQVARWLKLAEQRVSAGKVVVPEGDSALHYYQKVLEQDPANQVARKQLETVSARIIPDLNLAISQRRWEEARTLLESAEKAYPGNLELIAVKKRFWDLRDSASASEGPRITGAGQSKGFMGGLFSGGNRVISVYFKYEGFGDDNRKLTVRLLNGARSDVLDTETEMISRDSGRKVVKFDDRSGFSDGWYEMDILNGQHYLHTERFKLSE